MNKFKFNWRKPLIYSLFYLTNREVYNWIKEIKRLEKMSKNEIEEYQKDKLKKLLLHAWQNVPYYKDVLEQSKVVENGIINLNNFDKISYLTKEIIRREGKNIYSKDYKSRKTYANTSGGSTGEPLQLIQDKHYNNINYIVNKIYFQSFNGKDLGELEIDLWASMRDMQRNYGHYKEIFINFLYNRIILNSFKMSEDDMRRYVDIINKKKPRSMWVFAESIDAFCKFIKKNNLKITHHPKFILSTATTLYPEIRALAEEVFGCPVLNQYGSREVGAMTVECKYKNSHSFFWSHYIEVVNSEIVVTLFTNYSMPLIRYKIGDRATSAESFLCQCGHVTAPLKDMDGKVVTQFKKENGDLISSYYFIRLLFFQSWIKQYKLIQRDYNLIEFKIVLNGKSDEIAMRKFEDEVRYTMGENCKVRWDFVGEIEPTPSGKYIYTVCEIK